MGDVGVSYFWGNCIWTMYLVASKKQRRVILVLICAHFPVIEQMRDCSFKRMILWWSLKPVLASIQACHSFLPQSPPAGLPPPKPPGQPCSSHISSTCRFFFFTPPSLLLFSCPCPNLHHSLQSSPSHVFWRDLGTCTPFLSHGKDSGYANFLQKNTVHVSFQMVNTA